MELRLWDSCNKISLDKSQPENVRKAHELQKDNLVKS